MICASNKELAYPVLFLHGVGGINQTACEPSKSAIVKLHLLQLTLARWDERFQVLAVDLPQAIQVIPLQTSRTSTRVAGLGLSGVWLVKGCHLARPPFVHPYSTQRLGGE